MEAENKKVVWAVHAIMLVGNIVLLAFLVLLALFVNYMGTDFALGWMLGFAFLQIYSRVIHGKWIDP